MIRHSDNASESWKTIPWKQFRRNLFRLQRRVFKAVRAGDKRKAMSLQKLILKSTTARLMAIRQVTQLNAGKKTAGIDGKKRNCCRHQAMTGNIRNCVIFPSQKKMAVPECLKSQLWRTELGNASQNMP
jgi:N-terminal domain of reverse transcriptase